MTSIDETFEGFTPTERRYRESSSDYVRNEIERFMMKQDSPLVTADDLSQNLWPLPLITCRNHGRDRI